MQSNTWFNTPARRIAGALGSLIALTVLLRLTAGTKWQAIILASLPGAVAAFLMWRCWRQFAALKRQFIRYEIRLVQSWYALKARPPFVLILHVLGFALAFVAIAAQFGAGRVAGEFAMDGAFVVLAMAGVFDAAVLTSRIVKQAWAPVAGKLLALTICVGLAAVSLAAAKSVTHALSHIDPKYLTEFTAVLTCCMLPLVYASATALVLLLHALCQMLMFIVAAVGSSLLTLPTFSAQRPRRKALRVTWYRFRYRKNPAGGLPPEPGFLSNEQILQVTAPLSKLALAGLLIMGEHVVEDGLAAAAPFLARVLVSMEYRPNTSCANIEQAVPVAYMEDGWVSVAHHAPEAVTFSIMKCEFPAPPKSAFR